MDTLKVGDKFRIIKPGNCYCNWEGEISMVSTNAILKDLIPNALEEKILWYHCHVHNPKIAGSAIMEIMLAPSEVADGTLERIDTYTPPPDED